MCKKNLFSSAIFFTFCARKKWLQHNTHNLIVVCKGFMNKINFGRLSIENIRYGLDQNKKWSTDKTFHPGSKSLMTV